MADSVPGPEGIEAMRARNLTVYERHDDPFRWGVYTGAGMLKRDVARFVERSDADAFTAHAALVSQLAPLNTAIGKAMGHIDAGETGYAFDVLRAALVDAGPDAVPPLNVDALDVALDEFDYRDDMPLRMIREAGSTSLAKRAIFFDAYRRGLHAAMPAAQEERKP